MGRYKRQSDIIDREKISKEGATVIGIGAIGRQVSLQLAAIGIGKLQLIDFDSVSEENLSSQGFFPNEIGRPKVDMVEAYIISFNRDVKVETHNKRFNRSIRYYSNIFCCVDNMESRKFIRKIIPDNALFIDGRMGAETFRLLCCTDYKSSIAYRKTLFRDEEALNEPCTGRTTIYCANIAAGMMVSAYTKKLRDIPVDRDVLVNLLTNEVQTI